MATSASVTAAPSWHSFPFFDPSPVKDSLDLASSPALLQNPHEVSLLASSSMGVLLADISGNVHVLNEKFESKMSWVAFAGGRVTHMIERRMTLVTIGEEEASTLPIMKVWQLNRTDTSSGNPLLLRSVKIQHGNRPYPVSAVAISTSLSYLAIGLADGAVLLYRHFDQSIFSGSTSLTALPKPRLVHEDVTEPVTGLGFREPFEDSPNLYLFVVTTNRVLVYQTAGKGSGGSPTVVDEVGAALGCSVMDWKARDMVIARDEAIYLCGPEGRGNSFAYEGHKSSVHTHLNYLVIVSPPFIPSANNPSATVRNYVARAPASNATDISKVTVFDLENKFVAHSSTFVEGVRTVVSGWDQIFVLSNDGKLTRLEEKSTTAKLDMLFAKQLFSMALGLAKTQGLEPSRVADIHRRYGDHLYSKGNYDTAMQQYIKTIGHVQSSYVVRKFLDAQRIHNLVNYLQELHNLGLANSDHTTLLLNAYTKLKDVDRLDSFIKTEARHPSTGDDKDPLPFDLDTVIRVCRQAGYFGHASYLAKKYNRHEDYLRIQIEDSSHYQEAIAYLRKLDPESTEISLTRYGRPLLTNLPDETTQLLIDICTGSASLPVESDVLPTSATKASNSAPSYLSYLALGRGAGPSGIDLPAAPSPTPSVIPKKGPEPPNNPVTRQASTQERSATGSPAPQSVLTVKPKPVKLPSPRPFFAHFVEHMDKFVVFLEAVALRRWGYTVDDLASTIKKDFEPSADEEADKQDQVAICNTLLEIYLTLSEKESNKILEEKALRLLKSDRIPYDQTHALILCSMKGFTPGLVYLWEKMGMYEDVLRFWMDKDKQGNTPEASAQVVHYLNQYGPQHKHLYPLVLRFLTSSPALLTKHADDLEKILDYVTEAKVMPPLVVIQILSRNKAASVGLVKKWLMGRIQESRAEVQADGDLYNSYREETKAKLKQIAELSDPNNPKVFHVTRCSACGAQLDLPTIHFMCNHSYHQRCLIGQETECPNCARSHAVIREIRRNNEMLAGQHDLFQAEVQENGFSAIANAFGRGILKVPRPAKP